MKAKLNFKGRGIKIPDVENCRGINKFLGLMFKSKNANALLFEFSKPTRQAIHSLFCPDFLAIWLNHGKIVDYKLVNSWKFSIKPKKEFTHLLEIPLTNKYSHITKIFIEKICNSDEKRKI